MGKYVTKNQKEDEKRVVSVRIRRPIFEAFKGCLEGVGGCWRVFRGVLGVCMVYIHV